MHGVRVRVRYQVRLLVNYFFLEIWPRVFDSLGWTLRRAIKNYYCPSFGIRQMAEWGLQIVDSLWNSHPEQLGVGAIQAPGLHTRRVPTRRDQVDE